MDEWMQEVIDDMTLEDLPESYQDVAQVVGIKAALELSDCLGGLNYYFPKPDKMLIEVRNKRIRREFSGANIKQLAKKYRLTEIQIRAIVDKKDRLKRP